jgi:ABC-2 type transport system permease protein
MPKLTGDVVEPYQSEGEEGRQLLGVLVSGRFESFFDESPLLQEEAALVSEESEDGRIGDDENENGEDAGPGTVSGVIKRSPESARLLVFGSNSFVSDQIIQLVGVANGQLYTRPLDLIQNVVDWAVEDEVLQTIRGRNQYASTLPPLGDLGQRVYEYGNYALALLMVFVVFLIHRYLGAKRRDRYLAVLGETS